MIVRLLLFNYYYSIIVIKLLFKSLGLVFGVPVQASAPAFVVAEPMKKGRNKSLNKTNKAQCLQKNKITKLCNGTQKTKSIEENRQ